MMIQCQHNTLNAYAHECMVNNFIFLCTAILDLEHFYCYRFYVFMKIKLYFEKDKNMICFLWHFKNTLKAIKFKWVFCLHFILCPDTCFNLPPDFKMALNARPDWHTLVLCRTECSNWKPSSISLALVWPQTQHLVPDRSPV